MYHNLGEIEAALALLTAAYPAVCKAVNPPHGTFNGNTVRGVRLGADGDRPAILLWSGVHAREWVPPEVCLSLAADLLEAYDTGKGLSYGSSVKFAAGQIRAILDTCHVYVVPVANPDGLAHSHTLDANWRMNRTPSGLAGCFGVDLNRNLDFLWDFRQKLSPLSQPHVTDNPCSLSQEYCGPGVMSEAESKNLKWMLDLHPSIEWFIDLHSYGPWILMGWGDDEWQDKDPLMSFGNPVFDGVRGLKGDLAYREYIDPQDYQALKAVAERIRQGIFGVRSVDYKLLQSFGLYPTTGTTVDYAYSRHRQDSRASKVLGLTIEMGTDFQPPYREAKKIIVEVSSGLVGGMAAIIGL